MRVSPGPLILPWQGIWPRIAADAFIAPGAVIIGDVEIAEGTSIWFGCILRGDVNAIRIGARSNIQDGTVVHVASGDGIGAAGAFPTEIGADVTVGHMALLHACRVEEAGFVGMKACLLDGSSIGSGGMLAAGAVLSPGRRVPGGELWAGVPAKPLRTLPEDVIDQHRAHAAHYRDLAQAYLQAGIGGAR